MTTHSYQVQMAMNALEAAILEYRNHEVIRAHEALQEAGIISPSLVVGINDLASFGNTRGEAILDNLREELARRDERGDFAEGWLSAIAFIEELEEKWDTGRKLGKPG